MRFSSALVPPVLTCVASTIVALSTAGKAAPAVAGAAAVPSHGAAATRHVGNPGLLRWLAGWSGTHPPARPAAALAGHVYPLWRLPAGERPGARPGGQVVPRSIGAPGGYDPAELRAYLGLRGAGSGLTLTVTEAFDVQNPLPITTFGRQNDVTRGLAGYDRWFGLRPACSAKVTKGCFRLTFAAPHGTAAADPSVIYPWTIEATLDVELLHALLPQAAITVVEGRDDATASMAAAIRYARGLHPAAVSNSWGEDEFPGEQAVADHCLSTGPVCVFSSGDCGEYRVSSCPAGSVGGWPAADPRVLAVGGTTLDLAATGKVLSEWAWSGSGGGVSRYEPFPGYQSAADPWHAGRGVPDVSFDADPNSGVAAEFQAYPLNPYWVEIGGTSVGAPAWAAVIAAADHLRAAAGEPPLNSAGVHAAVYALAAGKPLADVTAGSNGICGLACSARPGYDLVTGEGSPRLGLVTYLAQR